MTFPIKKSLKGRRAAVIGLNVAGLSAAVALAVRGARVVVLDRNGTPPEESFPLPGLFSSPQVFAELFAGAEQRLSDFVDLERVDPLCSIAFPDCEPIELSQQPELLAAQVARIDESDAARVPAFVARCARAYGSLDRVGPAVAQRANPVVSLARLLYSETNRSAAGTYLRAVSRTFRNPAVRDIVMSLGVLTGARHLGPARDGLARTGELLLHGGWRIDGGADALYGALRRLCEILHIRILDDSRADRLEFENGQLRRVVGRGFKPLTTSIVTFAGRREDLRPILPDGEAAADFWEMAGDVQRTSTAIRFRFRLSAPLPSLGRATIFAGTNSAAESLQRERWWIPPTEPAILAAVSPDGLSLNTLHRVPPVTKRFVWTRDHLDQEQSLVIERLVAAGHGKLRSLIEDATTQSPAQRPVRDASRPSRAERRRHLLGESLPPRIPDFPGLYFCGDGEDVYTCSPADAAWRGMRAAALAGEDA